MLYFRLLGFASSYIYLELYLGYKLVTDVALVTKTVNFNVSLANSAVTYASRDSCRPDLTQKSHRSFPPASFHRASTRPRVFPSFPTRSSPIRRIFANNLWSINLIARTGGAGCDARVIYSRKINNSHERLLRNDEY